ncbi:TSSK6-activating co-chaperone protein isoform X2 [Crotalus tigris]|uniref:TSSK6-activating co-chaperone protein isoform X2 n=2 Tax=Crotalus tigris TaxID=88082 RepID=UPI00192F8FC1|nr:TSSK6-activating co-chaperone protein isoform X2 [Crotalus tigris]
MRPARRRSLQGPQRFVPGRPQPRGMSSSPIQMEPDLNPQEEKQHRKKDLDGPPATSFKPLCPAKPSPSFLELPSTQWRPSPVLPHPQASRTGKGKRHFAPDHQPQECFGLLECLHNNMQVQTQIAQEQLALLQDIRESINLLLVKQDQQNGELRGQLEQHPPRDSASLPHPGS